MTYGLVGNPLTHSYSKEIHEALGKYDYSLFSLSPEEMREFINSRRFSGLNVTIPYKKDVIPLCDEISPLAKSIGAVNTLYWKDSLDKSTGGRVLAGHNTDYEGFLYAASRADISFENKRVLILGSGGTSLMARRAVRDKGAGKIYIASRSKNTGEKTKIPAKMNLGTETKEKAKAEAKKEVCQALEETISYEELTAIASGVHVIVNTTPVGTYPHNLESVISLKDFTSCESVIDVIYNPFKTALLLEAEKLGLKASNGLPMLVAQATAAAGYFLGTPGAFEGENERIISQMERQMKNIVLIGMPGSGKSTIGRLLSNITGKPLMDMDDEIVKEAGISIPEIFEREGEQGFRDRESAAAERLGKQRGLIISTGGGTVLRGKNTDALRQNGLVIHIKRPVNTLATKGRPLSKNPQALREMEKVRLPIYQSAADITFDNSKPMSKSKLAENLKQLLKSEL